MRVLLFAALLFVAPLNPAMSRGEQGRFIVAELARQRLIDTGQGEVDRLVGSELTLPKASHLCCHGPQVGRMMTDELIGLKLLDKHDVEKQDPKMPAYKKYFMHGTSHHLGLDVHDFASRYKPFEVGNILTCEPGIYIPQEGLGIRIENNILITKDGNIDLMADIPVEADEIESIMNS